MRIEQRLNEVGRGDLMAVDQMEQEKWFKALDKLNPGNVDESSAFNLSCLYSLLRLNPAVCDPQLNNAASPAK